MTDPLSDIRHYSPTMTISQVMKFCEKKELTITRAMIQNYVRDKLLPPPVNKRLYTHKHLAALVMINRLKTVFDIPAIREALTPFMDEEGLPLEAYTEMQNKIGYLTQKWLFINKEMLAAENDGGTLLTMVCAAELKSAVVSAH
jgi:DNA-binding transcriptional MerR regulator